MRDGIVSSFNKLIGSANPIFWIVINSLQLDKIYYTHMDKIKNKRIIFYNIIIKNLNMKSDSSMKANTLSKNNIDNQIFKFVYYILK